MTQLSMPLNGEYPRNIYRIAFSNRLSSDLIGNHLVLSSILRVLSAGVGAAAWLTSHPKSTDLPACRLFNTTE
jgi:hypothetical protein